MARYLLLLLWVVSGPALAQHEHRAAGGVESPERLSTPFARFAKEMDAGMTQMVRDMHAPGYTGDPDVDFLAMMIPHHEGAVEMARLVLIHGRDPLTRKLAEEIIAGQTVEIEGMKRRLSILRIQPDPEPGGFPALGGTRGAAH
jgi:Uncharacterized protein conserved in bacteria